MREIRKIYFGEKRRQFRRYLGKVGLAYGLAVAVGLVSRIFSDQKKHKQAQ